MRAWRGTQFWVALVFGSAGGSAASTGCRDAHQGNHWVQTARSVTLPEAESSPEAEAPRAGSSADPGAHATHGAYGKPGDLPARVPPACEDPVLHFRDGALRGPLCPGEARQRGLTIVDLSDTWTPALFAPGPRYLPPPEEDRDAPAVAEVAQASGASPTPQVLTSTAPLGSSEELLPAEPAPAEPVPAAPVPAEAEDDTPEYRATFLALANERFDATGEDVDITREDRYLELYGVFPTLSVLRERFAGEQRHACHAAVDDAPLAAQSRILREERFSVGYKRVQTARWLRTTLERARARGDHDTMDALAASNPYYRRQVQRLAQLETAVQAIAAAEAHLVCEGLLEAKRVDGVLDWHTGEALQLFHRKHFVVALGQLNDESRAALATDSRELDFRAALRVLRERVVDATGLIEDGSARNRPEPILGRILDPHIMYAVPGHEPLADGAPDLIARATEAAARHLGWTDLDALARFLDAHAERPPVTLRVALALPALPAYHGEHMDLRVTIERGDVWYDPAPRWRPVKRRPAITVYAVVHDREIPLVRWPTTIGGWQKERLPSGAVVNRYKDSEVGPRMWRDLYAAPAWFPPPSTPDRDLVRRRWDGSYVIKRDTLGPSYRSAYGLAMFIHHQVVNVRDTERFDDHGVRTHGSASYTSIVRGVSHGCHRLFNHQAVRLSSFILTHRHHRRHGEETRHYDRVVYQGRRHEISLRSRGYRYELVPPIPVMVTQGRIHTRRTKPWR